MPHDYNGGSFPFFIRAMSLPPDIAAKYADCLQYIDEHWERVTFFDKKGRGVYVGLPHPFVSPNEHIYKYDLFYWDTFFTICGLVVDRRITLAKGMVDNLIYLFRKFNIMPHRNRMYNLGTSQPPFFTSMALEVYKRDEDKRWLRRVARTAEAELEHVWMNRTAPEQRIIFRDLSRYSDHFITNHSAEHESGWDMTSRFQERALDILPVDLNSCLYKYESDLAEIYDILKNKGAAERYREQAAKRKATMTELMWNEEKGMFFDYDHRHEKQMDFWSLAGYFPLWAGLATPEQAKKMQANLKVFEAPGGIANSGPDGLLEPYRQWDYPNGWPNTTWIVFEGLRKYGFVEDAERIAQKWIDLNAKFYKDTGKFWEKYDVVNCDIGKSGAYPTQDGFSWTNAIFVRLLHELYGQN